MHYHFHDFLALNHTVTVRFSAKICFFSLCPKDLADMSAKSWMMSCRHVVWQVGMTFFPNVGPTFPTFCQHAYMCWDNMSFGGSWQRDTMPTFPTKLGLGLGRNVAHVARMDTLMLNVGKSSLTKLQNGTRI